ASPNDEPGWLWQLVLAADQFIVKRPLPSNADGRSIIAGYHWFGDWGRDATLWYFEAIRQYFSVTEDLSLLKELFPVLVGIIDAHVRGTRYNIKVDPQDGLLFAGSPLVQLTWMDSKLGDWVVTPRIGKPVEINALWINALETMAEFAKLLVR